MPGAANNGLSSAGSSAAASSPPASSPPKPRSSPPKSSPPASSPPAGAAAASRHKGNMTYNPQGLIPKVVKKKNSEKRIGKLLNQKHHLGQNNQILLETEYSQQYTNYPTEILEFKHENDTKHPTQKPIPLCEYLVKTYSNEGQIVLDNCMGSGTTGVACGRTNRNFIGIEMDDEFFYISK